MKLVEIRYDLRLGDPQKHGRLTNAQACDATAKALTRAGLSVSRHDVSDWILNAFSGTDDDNEEGHRRQLINQRFKAAGFTWYGTQNKREELARALEKLKVHNANEVARAIFHEAD